MRKYAILFIFCTLFLFNVTVFASGETLSQSLNISNARVQKVYVNFSQKLNNQISLHLSSLSLEAKNELSQIARDMEMDFHKIDTYVQTQDRTNGITTVNHINSLVARMRTIFLIQTSTLAQNSTTTSIETKPVNITYYADNFEGGNTAGGNIFSNSFFSSANCAVPFNSFVQVIYGQKSILVKNNDRPNCRLHPDLIDLSTQAFLTLAPLSRGKLAGEYAILGSTNIEYTKRYIPTDFFSSLQVRLDENIPNAYALNETFHLSGQIIDNKDAVILFLVLPSGKQFNVSDNVVSGHFSFSIPLSELGKYRLVVASGSGFETTQFFEFQVFDSSVFAGKKLFPDSFGALTNLDVSRHVFRDLSAVDVFHFPGDAWRDITIQQGNQIVHGSGIGDIVFWTDAFKGFKIGESAHIKVIAAHSSTNFSQDVYSIPTTIFEKDMKIGESLGKEKNEKFDAILLNDGIHISGVLSPNTRIEKDFFVTLPDGNVQSYIFDSQYIDENSNILKTDGIIDQRIPVNEDGVYTIEVNYDTGFAALNTPIIKGNILPVGSNPEDNVTKKEIEHLTIDSARNQSILDINALRKSVGIGALTLDPTLNTLALIKAQDMADNNYIGHVDSKGFRILGTAKNNNITVIGSVGENVAGGNTNINVLIAGLEMSGGHRKNMLDTSWGKVGVGYVEKDGKVYYSQVFGE